MKGRRVLELGLLVVALAIVTGCGNKKKPVENVEQTIVAVDSFSTVSKYNGTIPAADCPGINTTLVLKWTKTKGVDNRFELTQEYIDRETFTSSGNFNTERGYGDDIDATVVILNYDKPQSEQGYYVWFSKDPKVLHVLSPSKELIQDHSLNDILKKVE